MFTVTISGNAEGVEAEQEVVDFLYKMTAIFRQEGSPADIHNAIFNGSHTSVTNLLSNPEPPVEEPVNTAPVKEDKPAWDTSVPKEVSFPSDLPPDTVLPADTEVHQTGPDTGQTWTPAPAPDPAEVGAPSPPLTSSPATGDQTVSSSVPVGGASPGNAGVVGDGTTGAGDGTPGNSADTVPGNASPDRTPNAGSADAGIGGAQ